MGFMELFRERGDNREGECKQTGRFSSDCSFNCIYNNVSITDNAL